MKSNIQNACCLFLVFFLTLGTFCFADEKQDLRRLGEELNKAKTCEILVSVKMYKSSSDAMPSDTYTGKLYRQGSNYYSDLMGEVYLQNEKCALYVDKSSKQIVYIKREQGDNGKAENLNELGEMQHMLDSLYDSRYVLKYVENSQQKKVISITDVKRNEYKKYYVTLDSKTGLLKQVEYEYIDHSKGKNKDFTERVVINYEKFNVNVSINKSEFSESKYIKHERSKIILTPAYTKYKLVDQTKK